MRRGFLLGPQFAIPCRADPHRVSTASSVSRLHEAGDTSKPAEALCLSMAAAHVRVDNAISSGRLLPPTALADVRVTGTFAGHAQDAAMEPLGHITQETMRAENVVANAFALHASAFACLTGELSVLCVQQNQGREAALVLFGKSWLRKNWKSHVGPVRRLARRLKTGRWHPLQSDEYRGAHQLFVEFADKYDYDDSSVFFRAMKLDDARKFVMVRDVMRLKLILNVYDANVLQTLRHSHALSVAFGDPSLFIDSCSKFQ